METAISNMRVGDYWMHGIELKATCACGRVRIIGGGLMPREFKPDDRISEWRLEQFARRLKCGNCGARGPKVELGRWS
jgi:hypothetical protein